MEIKRVDVRIEGIVPIIIHNVQLANPLNEWAQKIKVFSGKRKKTESDILKIQELEFMGSLYFDKEAGPYLPSQYIEAALASSMYAAKRISKAKTKAGLYADNPIIPLEYNGPRDMDKMWDSGKFHRCDMVKVATARVLRCRPCFPLPWAADFSLTIISSAIDPADIYEGLVYAGQFVGIGDWRPKFGRFNVVKFEVCKANKAA